MRRLTFRPWVSVVVGIITVFPIMILMCAIDSMTLTQVLKMVFISLPAGILMCFFTKTDAETKEYFRRKAIKKELRKAKEVLENV